MIKSLVLTAILIFSTCSIADSLFTAMHVKDNQEVIIALKDESGLKPTPRIVFMDEAGTKKTPIKIPNDLKGREVSALFVHHNFLYVLSQWTIGTGDKALLHGYDLDTKSWSKLGRFNCIIFDDITFENKKAILSCDQGKQSEIAIPKLQMAMSRKVSLPQAKVDLSQEKSMSFEGLKFYWRKMKSSGGTNKKIHVFSASEFF